MKKQPVQVSSTLSALKLKTLAASALVGCTALLVACSPQDRTEVKAEASKAASAAGNAASTAASSVGKAAEGATESAVSSADDASVTAKVKSALLADEQVKGLQINVDTAGGKVVLSGTAKSDTEKQRAEQLAMQVEGVRGVQNNIAVGGG